jgi:hypothetical protein
VAGSLTITFTVAGAPELILELLLHAKRKKIAPAIVARANVKKSAPLPMAEPPAISRNRA